MKATDVDSFLAEIAHISTIGKLVEDGARSGDRAGLGAAISEYGEYLSKVQITYE